MSVINMSITAVPLITVITAVRFFTLYKLPKKTFNILWTIILCGLLVPYNLFARFDVTALGEKVSEIFVRTPEITDIAPTVDNPVTPADTSGIEIEGIPYSVLYNIFGAVDRFGKEMYDRIEMMNTTGADILMVTAESAADTISLSISPLLLIWLGGFLCFAAYFIIMHKKFRKVYDEALPVDSSFVRAWRVEYSDSMRRKVKIRQSDLIRSPLTYGIFHPVILLPEAMDYNDKTTLNYILLHEYTHIRRFDVLAKLLLILALCVHWFNPFVWLMYMLANRDIELTCDETVVRETNGNESANLKRDYALTLIALEEKKNILTLGVHFSRNTMRERIKSIMKIKKQSKLRITAAVVLISMITAMFATLQSCEDNIGSGVEIIEITNEQGELIETQEIVVPLEPFDMQEQTDKLLIYTGNLSTYAVTPAINIFKEKYPHVEVEIVDLGDNYRSILAAELAAGKGPDLVYADYNVFPDIYKTMATEIFVDLNQFISRDIEFNLNDYVKGVLGGGIYRGRQYIMPIEYGTPILTTTQEILDIEELASADFNTFDGFMRIIGNYNEKYANNTDKFALINWHHNTTNLDYFLKYNDIDFINYEKTIVEIDKENFKKIIDFLKPIYVKEEDSDVIADTRVITAGLIQRGGLRDEHWLFNNRFNTTGYLFSLEHNWLVEDNRTPLMFTMPNINNGLTADIINFAAIPQASQNQSNAYNLLKILLSEEIQTGGDDGRNYLFLGSPILKRAIRTAIGNIPLQLDEETINSYTNMLINVDSANIIPKALYSFIMEEMKPYFEDTKSFDDCYARLVSRLEIYISE